MSFALFVVRKVELIDWITDTRWSSGQFDDYYSIILLRTVVLTNIYKCNKSIRFGVQDSSENITLMTFR